jgi:hypothetical protein
LGPYARDRKRQKTSQPLMLPTKIQEIDFVNRIAPRMWERSELLDKCGLKIGGTVDNRSLKAARRRLSFALRGVGIAAEVIGARLIFTITQDFPITKITVLGNEAVSKSVINALIPRLHPDLAAGQAKSKLLNAISNAYQTRGLAAPRIEDTSYVFEGYEQHIQLRIFEGEATQTSLQSTKTATAPEETDQQATPPPPVRASSWTGNYSLEDRARFIRGHMPQMMIEIDALALMIQERRFNDPESQMGIDLLRSLHSDLGLLIQAIEDDLDPSVLREIARKNEALVEMLRSGAKFYAVAPAMTFGIVYVLSGMFGLAVDSTLVSTAFGAAVALPLVRELRDKK